MTPCQAGGYMPPPNDYARLRFRAKAWHGVVCPRAKCMAWRLQGARCRPGWWGKEGANGVGMGLAVGERSEASRTSSATLLNPTPPHIRDVLETGSGLPGW
jgi:hypothetical protein